MLRDSTILVLDEAMSALDTRSTTFAQMAFDLTARSRAVVAVTHRLAAVKDADCILVMNEADRAEPAVPA